MVRGAGGCSGIWRCGSALAGGFACRSGAGREDKHELVDFTGSDRCSACIRLRRDILDTAAFQQWAGSRFVFVEIDIPRKPVLPVELLEKNKAVAECYGVAGFPTIMVLNVRGEVAERKGFVCEDSAAGEALLIPGLAALVFVLPVYAFQAHKACFLLLTRYDECVFLRLVFAPIRGGVIHVFNLVPFLPPF